MSDPNNPNPNQNQPYGQPYNPQYQQNPYQQNPNGEVPPYMQYRAYNQHPDRWNSMAIAGFVCSFFIAILGLIFSILGLVKINQTKEKGRGLAIAGIVISVLSMIFTFTTLAGTFDEFTESSVSSPTATASASSSLSDNTSDTSTDNDILAKYTRQLEDRINKTASDSAYTNVEQLVKTQSFQDELKSVTDALGDGVKANVSAKGDTVTTTLTVADDQEGQAKSMIAKLSSQQAHNDLQDLADSLDELCADEGNTNVHLIIRTDSGATLFDQSATADNE